MLVEVLADQRPAYLYRPFPLTELHETILPYRRYRRDLRFEAIEDYEMAILRLLAGEGGYVTVEPGEVREFLAREGKAVSPNTGVFRGIGEATVTLNRNALNTILQSRRAYAPPESDPAEPGAVAESVRADWPDPDAGIHPVEDIQTPPQEEPSGSVATPELSDTSLAETAPLPHGDQSPSTPIGPRCPRCTATLPVWRAIGYCPFCGIALRHTECRRCGERLEEGWRHCGACGEPLAE
jgi:hypothetical protein